MPQRTISYQGEPGANSHIICAQAYPDWTPLPCPSFEDAFAAVKEGRAARAMIPIENSIAGRVADIHHLIPTSGLHIVAEHFLPIHFQLMVLPGTPVDALKSVHTHVHALGQCRKIIRRLGLRPVVAGDTAGAAREIAEAGDPSRAALAPALAAEVYGLDILARDVEDESHNTTRFVVFSPEPEAVEPESGPVVTSFVFRVRNIPAALYKALGGFATNGVNMSKLESYMVEGQFSATQFYAEVDGHPDEPGLSRALAELAYFSREVRIIGTYPAHPYREASRVAAE
ncbi:prephenate dehydratase [Methylobacterium sp. J-068]|uniref:prephenate dehydratase n=1 Tax=Methylobacterium sp. J-068 TaxID=2836649 RepID=UPI001FB8FFC6|nr:prephenate dehydratase [Methylobacterium sp. J-068]MCJ2036548.1 prephenate dehydratase [Methylobacterium sp. J-068]